MFKVHDYDFRDYFFSLLQFWEKHASATYKLKS